MPPLLPSAQCSFDGNGFVASTNALSSNQGGGAINSDGQTSMFILLANFTSDFAGGCSPSPQSLTQARYLLPLLPSIPHPAPPLLSTPHSGPGNFGGAIFAQMSTMRMSSCM